MRIIDCKEFEAGSSPLSFSAQTKVSEAIKQMVQHNYGCIIVVDDDQNVCGIVSERDLLKRVIFEGADQHETILGEVMTPNVHVAKESDDIAGWLHTMSEEHFRHLPVVDKNGHLKGLISQGDLVAYTWPYLLKRVWHRNYEIMLIAGAFIVCAVASLVALKLLF